MNPAYCQHGRSMKFECGECVLDKVNRAHHVCDLLIAAFAIAAIAVAVYVLTHI